MTITAASMMVATVIGLTAAALQPAVAQAAEPEQFQGWYQVDVILFKPKSADLDEESWPEVVSIYPANVTAVTDGRVFKLSQLEQLDVLPTVEPVEAEPRLAASEFAFESRSNRNRNRSVIERVTGVSDDDVSSNNEPSSEPVTDDTSQARDIEPETKTPVAVSVDDIVETALAKVTENSRGALAFSDADAESSLQAILRSLRRSSRFTVLNHHTWVQPIDSEPTPILVQAGQRFDDRFEVEGTLSFSRSRFLHVQTNLWYTVFEPRGGSSNPYLAGFQSNLSDEVLSEYTDLVEVERERGQYYPARTHHMFQSRRMRSDELHYIDHPLFGIVVRINRFQPKTE